MNALITLKKALPVLILVALVLIGSSCTSSKKSGCPGAISFSHLLK